jgi:hypothetical protein
MKRLKDDLKRNKQSSKPNLDAAVQNHRWIRAAKASVIYALFWDITRHRIVDPH